MKHALYDTGSRVAQRMSLVIGDQLRLISDQLCSSITRTRLDQAPASNRTKRFTVTPAASSCLATDVF
jgi:hypothetical protein